jgi:hypothetical protein
MKKLLTLFIMLAALAAQAQTILEKDLLGSWKPVYVEAIGCTVDLQTREVSLTDEVLQQFKDSGTDNEKMIKENMLIRMETMAKDIYFSFIEGYKFDIFKNGVSKRGRYIITDNGDITIISSPDSDHSFGIKLINGRLLLAFNENNQVITVGFKKI